MNWTHVSCALATASLVAAGAVWSGCSNGGGSVDGGTDSGQQDSGIGGDTACADTAHAVCTKISTCTPAFLQLGYGDEATCEARLKANCLSSLAAPSTGYLPAAAEACANAYAGWTCTDYRNRTNIPAACAQAQGSLPGGTACEFGGQCQSGFCAIIPGSACGTCAAAPSPGDACDQLTTCGQALTCTPDTHQCVAYVAQGGTCGAGLLCGAALSCVAAGGLGTPGTCQPAGTTVGTTCDGSLKTAASCDPAFGLYCDGLTKQCAQSTFVASGSCGYTPDAGTLVQCTAGTCQGGVCAARAADNGACVVPDSGAYNPGVGCIPAARCVGGTCQTPAATSCH